MRRERLIEAFRRVRARTERLAEPLSEGDQSLRSLPAARATAWHRAHATRFFEAFVLGRDGEAGEGGEGLARAAEAADEAWSLTALRAYRRAVDGRVEGLLATLDDAALAAVAPTVWRGLAHEERHQEMLLEDLHHALAQSPRRAVYAPEPAVTVVGVRPAGGWIEHPGGTVEVGHDGVGFAFDHEGPRHGVTLAPFALARDLVRVRDVADFVRAGGYRTPSLWLPEGFERARAGAWAAPCFATVEGERVRAFTLHGECALDPDAPALHLSYFEADAIARFLGARLPTEFEWEALAQGESPEGGHQLDVSRDGLGSGLTPRAGGVASLFGSAWVWTTSPLAPYPGFVAAGGSGREAAGGRVLRGGSMYTPRGHLRATYRRGLQPEVRHRCTGLRLARSRR